MKKNTSIKARITIWYMALMFVMISVVLASVSILSYRLSTANMENELKLRVTQIAEKVRMRITDDAFFSVENNEEFKNVTIYRGNGQYVAGQYDYYLDDIEFKDGKLRRESVDGKEYLVYDIFKSVAPKNAAPENTVPQNQSQGFWIRGAESVAYPKTLGHSVLVSLLIIIPFILILTALGGYYTTKKAFLPVNNIIYTANEIYLKNDVKKRIPVNPDAHEDELHKLPLTLNRMLDRIEGLIAQEKQFTSDASHELRTPISVILAQGEYLLDIAEDEKQRELAQDIVTKAKQAAKLISRLLTLARIDNNSLKLSKEKVDLHLIVDIVAQNMREAADKKHIELITHIDGEPMIYADESLITSAISNLVSNAIKYGKESGYVMISVSEISGNVEIAVKDNGKGIANEQLEKIWTRFYRVDDVRNDEYGSCGLGLSMVKSIVELHGGRVEVHSVLGEGSEFKIIFEK
ncbi:MAG: HAMP domain-containing sensor histidine kinase [Clostridia bacterium]|nr:HAMP domain-containing sensor histidine kinase [Clostridia bacterium]